jgi:anti-anti-sigma regulatory factor
VIGADVVVSRQGAALSVVAPYSWLAVHDGDEVVVVTATGGIAAGRAAQLWCVIEEALDRSDGRPVAVDLAKVTAFDEGSLGEVVLVVRASLRRHLDLCVVTGSNTPLGHRLRCLLPERSPVFSSLHEALRDIRAA